MRRGTLWPLLLCLGVAQAGDPIADHDKAHGRPELARVGTIGDRPPAESTLVVHVHADGTILIDGKETTLDGLSGALAALRETKHEPAVLLRADARLPWMAMQFLLTLCAEQRIYRVFHAVLPEAGDEEGGLSWPLPRAAGPAKLSLRVEVQIALGGRAATPAHVYWAARKAKPGSAQIKAGAAVLSGHVLLAADALTRAGVGRIYAYGTNLPTRAERASDLKPLVKDLAAAAGEPGAAAAISVRFGREELGVAKADPMPAVDRVRGAFAGPAESVEDVDEVPLEEPEEPIEEPVVPLEEPEPEEAATQEPFTNPAPGRDGKRGQGTTRATEAAVELGLRWLADHQDEDGKWDCDGFASHDPADDKCDGPGAAPHDVGVTGLALLAFLGAGYTDRKPIENPYAGNVLRGLRYLTRNQAADGHFGTFATHTFMYNDAIATLVLCEAYWMTRNPRYKKPAQDGLNFIAMARNPDLAWRYVPRGGDNDTSVTAWCMMALLAGKSAGLEVDPDALRGTRAWIESMTGPDGRVGYRVPGGLPERAAGSVARWPPDRSQSMTAAGILARIVLGEDPRGSEPIGKGVKLCLERPPCWNPDSGSIDMYYWYWGTLAMFQVGGRRWDIWNKAMQEAIVKHQHPKGAGSRTGSWDPLDPWGNDGGRVYSTALMTMCLEVYYRYDRR
ncbi:MAG: biopolymer transporter ExbD [Planctomycetota bacterium]